MLRIMPSKSQTKSVEEISDSALQILREGFFAYFGNIESGCIPHLTTMFYIWDDDSRSVFLISSEGTRKVKNLKRNNEVSVTIDERDPLSPSGNRGVLIRGIGKLVTIEEMGDVLMNRYFAKYHDFLGTGFPLGSRIAIQVIPRSLNYWKGIEFTRWKNPSFSE
ncbi:MAG: pyridoxamine 5'-phosphate oxidase family protein [Candidatus Thorarchaeota archaeon]